MERPREGRKELEDRMGECVYLGVGKGGEREGHTHADLLGGPRV